MGEYTTRLRFDGRVDQGKGRYFYRSAQCTYSWRSRRSKYDLSDREAGTSLGVRTPRTTGSLFDILADRKRYAEELDSTMGALGNTNYAGARRYSATDTGHNFTTVKYDSVRQARFIREVNGIVNTDTPLQAFGQAYRLNDVSFPSFSTLKLPDAIATPGKSEQNARLNQTFNLINPVMPVAQIGETIVSLLRGEFPTLMKNITRFMKDFDLKGASKYAGGEYLNSAFGWQPLIRDIENAIKVLVAVDNLIYGQNFRRHRTITWDRKTSVSPVNALSYASAYGLPTGGSDAVRHNQPELTLSSKFDIRLSARMGSIARPTRGANSFISQAEDKLQQLGVWYPSLGWDLLPYSWLIDWFTNLGSSINNASYYSLGTKLVNIDYAWATSCLRVFGEVNFAKPVHKAGITTYKSYGTAQSLSVTKVRESATPFGFGVDLSGLNAGQVTILVALGLVKIP